jgi:hypothetical protein
VGVKKGFVIDPANPAGIFFTDYGFDALYLDDLQDALYVLDGVYIKKWDHGPTPMTVTHRSGIERGPSTVPFFSCLEANADTYPVTVKVDAVNLPAADVAKIVAANPLFTAPTSTSVRYTATVNGRSPVRLPGGFHAQDFQVEASATGGTQSIAVAHGMDELGQV